MLSKTPISILTALATIYSTTRAAEYQRHAPIGLGPRQEHSVVSTNNTVYIIGGVNYNDIGTVQTVNRVEAYDTTTDKWTVTAPVPIPMNHANAASVNENIYVLGALSADTTWQAVGNSYMYSPHNDSWTTLTPMPDGTWRGSSAVGVYSSTIYLAGGMTYLQPFPGGTQNAISSVISFDTELNTWDTTSLPPLPSPRQHVGGAVINSTFYVLGGREDGIETVQNTVFALDLENVTAGWQTLAPMPTARGSIACAALDTDSSDARIYCLGGENPEIQPYGVYANNEVYYVLEDRWEELEPMAVPRHGAGAVGVGGKVWYPGGATVTAAGPVGIMDAYMP